MTANPVQATVCKRCTTPRVEVMSDASQQVLEEWLFRDMSLQNAGITLGLYTQVAAQAAEIQREQDAYGLCTIGFEAARLRIEHKAVLLCLLLHIQLCFFAHGRTAVERSGNRGLRNANQLCKFTRCHRPLPFEKFLPAARFSLDTILFDNKGFAFCCQLQVLMTVHMFVFGRKRIQAYLAAAKWFRKSSEVVNCEGSLPLIQFTMASTSETPKVHWRFLHQMRGMQSFAESLKTYHLKTARIPSPEGHTERTGITRCWRLRLALPVKFFLCV